MWGIRVTGIHLEPIFGDRKYSRRMFLKDAKRLFLLRKRFAEFVTALVIMCRGEQFPGRRGRRAGPCDSSPSCTAVVVIGADRQEQERRVI